MAREIKHKEEEEDKNKEMKEYRNQLNNNPIQVNALCDQEIE